jgi:nuclear receptor interaction protein
MAFALADRLLHREVGDTNRSYQIKGLYGDRYFVEDLDIVNELSGHTGCVNALRLVM